MKKAITFCLTLLLAMLIFVLVNSAFGADNPGLNPRKLFEEGWVGYRSAKTLHEKEDIYMAIIKVSDPHKDWYTVDEVKRLFKENKWEKNDRVIMRKRMTRYLKYDAGLEDKMYIYFNFPPRDENTQFVIWRYPNKADDMWMYAPTLKRNRRLAAADQEDHFMGSTFTYEDIRRLMGEVGQTADQFIFLLAKEEAVISGRRCYVIEVRPDPAKKLNTGYGLRKFYQVKNSPAFVRVEYFDKNGRLLKMQNNLSISYAGLWRPRLVEMYEAATETTTVLYWTERRVGLDEKNDKELPFGVFTPIYMERHGR